MKIREITRNFALPEYACVTYRALMSSFDELERDLHLHIHLENNILFPRAEPWKQPDAKIVAHLTKPGLTMHSKCIVWNQF